MTTQISSTPLSDLLRDKSLRKAWHQHRANANRRNIRTTLSFEQYVDIWYRSGHINERGKKPHEYCLSRHGDKGIYEVGNVSVKTNHENAVENGKRKRTVKELKAMLALPTTRHACIIDGTYYESLGKASRALGINHRTLGYRLESKYFTEYRSA